MNIKLNKKLKNRFFFVQSAKKDLEMYSKRDLHFIILFETQIFLKNKNKTLEMYIKRDYLSSSF